MKIISHRGNVRGPIKDKENRPSYIDCALGNGYDVEIDLRVIGDELWLGHDEPQYKSLTDGLENVGKTSGSIVKILKQQRSAGDTMPFVTPQIILFILQLVLYGYMI